MTEDYCGNNATPSSNFDDATPSGISSCSDNSSPGSSSVEDNINASVEIDEAENFQDSSWKANKFANIGNTSEDEGGCEEDSQGECWNDLGTCDIETNKSELDITQLLKSFKVDKSLASKNMVVMQEVELSVPDSPEESDMTEDSIGALDIAKPSPCCQEDMADDSHMCSDLVTCVPSYQSCSIPCSPDNLFTAPSECTDQNVDYPTPLSKDMVLLPTSSTAFSKNDISVRKVDADTIQKSVMVFASKMESTILKLLHTESKSRYSHITTKSRSKSYEEIWHDTEHSFESLASFPHPASDEKYQHTSDTPSATSACLVKSEWPLSYGSCTDVGVKTQAGGGVFNFISEEPSVKNSHAVIHFSSMFGEDEDCGGSLTVL